MLHCSLTELYGALVAWSSDKASFTYEIVRLIILLPTHVKRVATLFINALAIE